MPSLIPPIICASSPRGLIARPGSTAKITLVTRGPPTPSRILRFTVAGREFRRPRGDDLADTMGEVGGHAGVPLLEGQHVVPEIGGANPRGAHRMGAPLPGVVGAVPHQLHRLAEFLGDFRGFLRGVE